MIKILYLLLFMASFAVTSRLCAQACPENIGFENGNFQNWKIYTGITIIENNANSVHTKEVTTPSSSRHSIISDKNLIDPYGKFKIIPPDRGGYAVKLGNDGTGNQADMISYVISVPANRPEFTLTYKYAVVLEDPNHLPEQQPRFIARVKDLEKDEYIQCASFEYVAISNLPGFQKAASKETVIYKDWTPVTINLSGYQGKKILLEFISADCTLGGHFGYAYVDVENLCGDLIIGGNYCKNADRLNLSGPSGFKEYNWYNGDRSVKYGSGQSLIIKPTPPDGTKITLDLLPYTGFGCPSTITTVVRSVDYQVKVLDKVSVCENNTIDFTSSDFILNKSPEFTYLVYKDKDLTQQVTDKVIVNKNSTFYIKATNYKGCESFAAIDVSVYDVANITAKKPGAACYNGTVDITADELYTGSLAGISRAYYTDAAATNPITDPKHIKTPGVYYARLSNAFGCTNILPVEVTLNSKPLLKITDPAAACYPLKVDISANDIFKGSDTGLTFRFFANQSLTIPVTNPKEIDRPGVYYVQATNAAGCSVTGQVKVAINDLPILVIRNPKEACAPQSVNITADSLFEGSTAGLSYSFFFDESLSKKVSYPEAINKPGTYYVKATNSSGCSASGTIDVMINNLPEISVHNPGAVFDGQSVDLTAAEVISGSKNYVQVAYFKDAALTETLARPESVTKTGIYYISLTNSSGCSVSAPVEINILPEPKIVVPTAFTPHKETNNRLYPFLVSMQKLISFKVFNKWGMLVYQATDASAQGWDGQFKSKMQPLETFSWYAEGIDASGRKYHSTGKTILIL